ncbi:MAG: tRNA (adenosine(37)-N6)-threonylcarbamoyltransferase complex dimerization subunit type 1 TsaB [Segniliparus sp.]|uniref:tRNA (adenosine(37)-N6)-threonylcarbamoyltransferase complex dimerization subunit type 1 TsaB n=1 Tax=Segniliparus sp. TaxID=2804064 RepID=UPI003F33CF5D
MLVLTIDTSTETTNVGGVWFDGLDGKIQNVVTRSAVDSKHVEQIASLAEEILEWTDGAAQGLDAVVVGVGPGPYTGLRIGIAAAAAFGDALGVPVHGVCSLDALAVEVDEDWDNPGRVFHDVLSVLDAKRREVFWALHHDGQRVLGPAVCRPDELPGFLEGRNVDVSVGATQLLPSSVTELFGGVRPQSPQPWGLATLAIPALLAGEPPASLVPLYLRPPDAKPPASMKGIPA